MARLVIGTSKAKTVPAVVRDMSPTYYKEFMLSGTTLVKKTNQVLDFSGVTTIGEGTIDYLFVGATVAPDFKDVANIVSMVGTFTDTTFGSIDFKNVTTIGNMTDAFKFSLVRNNSEIDVDFGDVTTITNASGAFSGKAIRNFSAPNLTTVTNASNMFYALGGRKTSSSWRCPLIDLSSLTTTNNASWMFGSARVSKIILGFTGPGAKLASGDHNYTFSQMCQGCYATHADLSGFTSLSAGYQMFFQSALRYVNFKNLASLPKDSNGNDGGLDNAFVSSGVRVLRFPSLTSVGQYALYNCLGDSNYATPHIYFYHHLDVINNLQSMCYNKSGVTVHFPIAEQAVIGSESIVTSGFGNASTTVLFDIVTTATGADGNDYIRQQKDSVLDNNFEPTATAWVYNNTLYYTSGANEPVVGDNIYSDSACQNVVTTVSAIA